ncbi:3-phosphoshikimate 1-carboxyvinyltransferase [Propionibacterium sp.]|uniref:3-phosphoshikimate 1-carboxyvinyltransferase n=1 Tax=Propionibacterium sp. TaxID=1977903 RepID=UPI0039ED14F9
MTIRAVKSVSLPSWAAPTSPEPLRARVEVPGSKSESNRALVIGALSEAPSTIQGVLHARDTELMINALTALGTGFGVDADGTVHVTPSELHAPAEPLDCGLAGTVMRFVPPIAALTPGVTHFTGDRRAGERPLAPMLDGLRQLGARIDADSIPFALTAPVELVGRTVKIDSSASSQFISGLLLSAARFPRGIDLQHVGNTVPSAPHIAMTVSILARHGVQVDADPAAGHWKVSPGPITAVDERIEPDLTNAAAFLAAGLLTSGSVSIASWPRHTDQPGALIGAIAARMNASVTMTPEGFTASTPSLSGAVLDLHEASELTPVVSALAVAARGTTKISGVGHIRGHETDRITAIATELSRLGVPVEEHPDGLDIVGMAGRLDELHPSIGDGLFHCYADHRMAHLGALIGLMVPGVVLDDVTCTSKTMPDFADRWTRMTESR